MMSRRGFLAALLASAVAPAYVKASSLMPILVPNRELILPSLAINFPEAIPGGEYTFSMYMKVKGNEWERVVKKMVADDHGVIKEKIQLYHQEQQVWGIQIESNQPMPQGFGRGGMNMNVSGNDDCKLLLNENDSPASNKNAFARAIITLS